MLMAVLSFLPNNRVNLLVAYLLHPCLQHWPRTTWKGLFWLTFADHSSLLRAVRDRTQGSNLKQKSWRKTARYLILWSLSQLSYVVQTLLHRHGPAFVDGVLSRQSSLKRFFYRAHSDLGTPSVETPTGKLITEAN